MFSSSNINRNNINNNVITTTTTNTATTTNTTTTNTTTSTITTKKNAITKTNKNFEYISNIEIDGWWRSEINTKRKLEYYVSLAEIAGCKLDQFDSFRKFLNFLRQIISERNSNLSYRLNYFLEKKDLIIKKNQFRLIEAEINKTRRIRSIKINRLRKSDDDKLMLLVQATKNKFPTILYQIILKEFLGLEFKSGCVECKKANRQLDIIISHKSSECKFTHKHLHCTHCRASVFKYTNHTTDKCRNFCSSCKSIFYRCHCENNPHNTCDNCSRPNTHCICDMYTENERDDRDNGYLCEDCGRPPSNCRC